MEKKAESSELLEVDKVLEERALESQPASLRQQQVRKIIGRLSGVPRLLRVLGAVVLLAAAGSFLVQQWGELNHIARYFGFLGFTMVLAGCGFFCGLRIRDDKGARTFLGIAAAIIPVHFTQLGGLIYSRGSEGLLGAVPKAFVWVAPDAFSAFIATLSGVLCLAIIAYISFSALCRAQAGRLTAAYIAGNALLLLPLRNPDWVALTALILFGAIAAFDCCYLRIRAEMRTAEGLYVRLMLAAPLVLILGRNLLMYPGSALLFAMLFAAQAVFLYACLPAYLGKGAGAVTAQGLSTISAAIAWYLAAIEILRSLHLGACYDLPLIVLPYAALLAAMSLYAQRGCRYYRTAAAVLVVGGMLLQLVAYESIFSSFLMVLTAILVVVYGYISEQKWVFLCGALGLACGVLYHIKYAFDAYYMYNLSPWVSLGLLGIMIVLASSYIERNYGLITDRMMSFRKKLSDWD